MTSDPGASVGRSSVVPNALPHELHHVGSHWWWLLLLVALLVASGTAAIVVPSVTIEMTLFVTIFLGVLMMVGGVATIVGAFWAGRWSGFLVQLLVGLLYLACGFVISDKPVVSAVAITLFIAVSFIVLGAFKAVGALVMRFPQWGWSLLNAVVTLLAGLIVYRQLPIDALWVIGLLVGLEMLFSGWTWIMLAVALRRMTSDVHSLEMRCFQSWVISRIGQGG